MKFSGEKVVEIYEKIQQKRPIIHCITNAVTVNDCANILLAAGASPTMAHHPCEVEEITAGTAALICNFGAISDYEAMKTAGKRAHALGHPIVIDPVGVSGSSYRREKCLELMKIIHPTCIRGNYSEIQALLHNCGTVTGVDAAEDALAEAEETDLPELMKQYAKENQKRWPRSSRPIIWSNTVGWLAGLASIPRMRPRMSRNESIKAATAPMARTASTTHRG